MASGGSPDSRLKTHLKRELQDSRLTSQIRLKTQGSRLVSGDKNHGHGMPCSDMAFIHRVRGKEFYGKYSGANAAWGPRGKKIKATGRGQTTETR